MDRARGCAGLVCYDFRWYFALIPALTLGPVALPHLAMKVFTSSSVKNARWAVVWFALFLGLLFSGTYVVGFAGNFFIGVTAISLWPLAPFIALLQMQTAGPAVPVATVFPAVYALAVNAKMLQHVFALSFTKMVIALSAAIVYMGCFLYLWV